MPPDLSDGELIRKVRGERTQQEFSGLVGIDRPMLSHYERGAVKPSSATWLKMAEIATYPDNIYCWQRAGLPDHIITVILDGLVAKDTRDHTFPGHTETVRKVELAKSLLPPSEPVTEPLGDEPASQPIEPVTGEAKPPAPAKKAKRERRRKK